MPITVTGGVLMRRYEDDSGSAVTAVVRYTLSNGASEQKEHGPIAMADLAALAAADGRAEYSRSDVIAYITNIFGPDLAPATITAPDIAGA
jgi:hypothetical protein